MYLLPAGFETACSLLHEKTNKAAIAKKKIAFFMSCRLLIIGFLFPKELPERTPMLFFLCLKEK
jgi:hypothetical protein